MKIIVNEHKINIIKNPINEKEINISECEFEFAESITEEYVKEAYFTLNGTTYKQEIINNKCSIPYEVLEEQGEVEIGVVAYLLDGDEYVKRYNPEPDFISTLYGSLKEEYENSEEVTPTDKEQMEQALQSGLNVISEAIAEASTLDIDASKSGKKATVTITKQDGTSKSVEIDDGIDGVNGQDGTDGVSLQYNWNGTSLGIKREDEQNYSYTNLKGAKGDTGAKGADGKDGKDGTNGTDGQDGFSPIASVTQTQSGATISITDENGTTTANVSNGTNGTNGQDGYTPVRGTDYWTANDISAIENHCDTYINTQLGPVNDVLATLTTVGGDE